LLSSRQTKHEIRLHGKEAESRKEQFTRENQMVECQFCLTLLSRYCTKTMKNYIEKYQLYLTLPPRF
jgi:hypothetical protein